MYLIVKLPKKTHFFRQINIHFTLEFKIQQNFVKLREFCVHWISSLGKKLCNFTGA